MTTPIKIGVKKTLTYICYSESCVLTSYALIIACFINTTETSQLMDMNFTYHKFCIQYKNIKYSANHQRLLPQTRQLIFLWHTILDLLNLPLSFLLLPQKIFYPTTIYFCYFIILIYIWDSFVFCILSSHLQIFHSFVRSFIHSFTNLTFTWPCIVINSYNKTN